MGDSPDIEDIDVIAPILKKRLSGVTSTTLRLVPLQARDIGIAVTGAVRADGVPHVPLGRVVLAARTAQGLPRWRVWHARRNTEMIVGVLLAKLMRRRFRLLFTSASQRRHTLLSKWLIRNMDAVIATSKAGEAYLEVPARVILHGIDAEAFAPVADKDAAASALGLPPGRYIGCFGRIRRQKGTDVFVDAMIAILGRFPDHRAVVLGRATGPHARFLDDLKDKIARAGLGDRILFPPEAGVEDMPAWYGVLELFVAPQRWEGFGVTPLEAMAAGLPVVATRVGAFEEIVVDGETGRLIPPGDVDAMIKASTEILGDRETAHRWGEAGRVRMLGRFRLEDEASAINECYRALLSGGMPPEVESQV